MDEKYIEVYSILSDVDKLMYDDYEYLISTYGKEVVDLVIEDLINEDENNFYRFQVDESDKGVKLYNYQSEVNSIECLDADKNYLLLIKINDIIRELEKIFIMFNCEKLVLDNGSNAWVEDKVFYCLKECNDSFLIERLNYLFDEYCSVRNTLVEGNLRLVMSIASNHKPNGLTSYSEIVQYGNIGLMKAVEFYDVRKRTTFSTYATIVVNYAIRNSYRNLKYPVKVTQYYTKSYRDILMVINDLSIQYGRMATYDEVAKYMKKSVLWVKNIINSFQEPLYLDDVVELEENRDSERRSSLIQGENTDVYDIVYQRYLEKEIKKILESNLTEKQLLVLMYNFGFYGQVYGLAEIASMLGVNRQNVFEKKKSALKRLRKKTNIMEYAID